MTRLCIVLLIIAGLSPATAVAQQDRDEALRLNAEAQKLFEDDQFEAAAKKFAEAFTVYAEPQILLGETIAWYKAGNCDIAVDRAAQYLREAKSASEVDRANVSKVQAECAVRAGHRALDSGDLAEATVELELARRLDVHDGASESITALDEAIEAARANDERPATAGDGTRATAPPDADLRANDSDSGGGGGRKILGWSFLGLGVVSLAGGTALTLSYASAVNGYEDDVVACSSSYASPSCTASRDDLVARKSQLDERRRKTRPPQIALFAAGGVLTAVGVGLLVWPRDNAEVSVGLTEVQLRVRF